MLLIPFVYGMNPPAGAAFLLSMHSIVHGVQRHTFRRLFPGDGFDVISGVLAL